MNLFAAFQNITLQKENVGDSMTSKLTAPGYLPFWKPPGTAPRPDCLFVTGIKEK